MNLKKLLLINLIILIFIALISIPSNYSSDEELEEDFYTFYNSYYSNTTISNESIEIMKDSFMQRNRNSIYSPNYFDRFLANIKYCYPLLAISIVIIFFHCAHRQELYGRSHWPLWPFK